VEGAVAAARDFGVEIVLVGIREILETELALHDTTGLSIRIEHAPEVVAMDDSPLESVLGKEQSSIHIGLELVKKADVHGFVSAGNSGAVMAAAMVILGNLPHVDRPAIGTLVPTTGGPTLLIDAGANTEVKPIHLAQFAVMGSVYSRRVRNIARPRVGILSNGEEASKGTELTRAAAAILTQDGAACELRRLCRRTRHQSRQGGRRRHGRLYRQRRAQDDGRVRGLPARPSARDVHRDLARAYRLSFHSQVLGEMRQHLDPHEDGRRSAARRRGVAIIAHGSSNARAIRNAIRAAGNEALVRQVSADIVEILAKTEQVMAPSPREKVSAGCSRRCASVCPALKKTRSASTPPHRASR